MYHPHHFLSQIKQMNQRTSVPAKKSQKFLVVRSLIRISADHGELRTMCNTETSKSDL